MKETAKVILLVIVLIATIAWMIYFGKTCWIDNAFMPAAETPAICFMAK